MKHMTIPPFFRKLGLSYFWSRSPSHTKLLAQKLSQIFSHKAKCFSHLFFHDLSSRFGFFTNLSQIKASCAKSFASHTEPFHFSSRLDLTTLSQPT